MSPDRIYRFMPANGVIKSLLNRNLRMSEISSLNDPYDMMLGVSDVPDQSEGQMKEFRSTLDSRTNLSKLASLISFSGKCNDPVMWAHYADNHRGICLEFDPSVLDKDSLKKMNYSDVRPSVTFSDLHNRESKKPKERFNKAMFDAFLNKSSSWSYEDEYRMIFMITDASTYEGFFNMPEGFLTGVILGMECEYKNINIRRVLNSSGYEHVPIYSAYPHDYKYEVDMHEHYVIDMGNIDQSDNEKVEARIQQAHDEYFSKRPYSNPI